MTKKYPGIKRATRQEVYGFLRNQQHATRNDIAGALGLSIPTVSKYLGHLTNTGLAVEKSKLTPGEEGGRAPSTYASVPNARIAIGVSITRRSVTSVAVNLQGEVLEGHRISLPFERSDAHARKVGDEVAALIEKARIPQEVLLGIGIAMPGLVDPATGTVVYGRVVDNEGFTSDHYSPYLPVNAHIIHDSYAGALAESWAWGSLQNAFHISLNESVGGAIIYQNEVFRQEGGYPGEVGHVTAVPDGEECYCGQRGCVETVCTSTKLTSKDCPSVEEFFARLDANSEGNAAWKTYTEYLAQTIRNVRALFGGLVILGGEVGSAMGKHISDVHSKIDERTLFGELAADYVKLSKQGRHPVAAGAALHFIQEFLQDPGP